ncbi:MAG: GNAT family N-acetyltransferase [Sphingomonadaceae bacterium]|nr:GNAT family N-acetyltransferase [Sphingomonadaceae bacterium]
MLDTQPTLTGPTVVLRPLAAGDWEPLFAVAADPAIWAIHPAHDRWQEPVFRRFFDEALASGGALVVLDRATRAVIGSSRFDFARVRAGEVEIGWTFLARSHWGGATNREVKALMVGHALPSVDRVIFRVGDTNLRSRRAMEKIGAVLTDRSDTAEMAGSTIRHVIYAIDRIAFAAGPLYTFNDREGKTANDWTPAEDQAQRELLLGWHELSPGDI